MISTKESLVSDLKVSTAVPANVTGDDKVHELSHMDLVMKLHYLRGVYFFDSEAVQGLTIWDFKNSMFPSLDLYNKASGRIRRSETGQLFVKYNDSGVRIVEAHCDKTIDECLAMKDHSLYDCRLVYNHALGPDLGFSPLVFVQFTWFKCGGVSVGLSWAHVLGDAFSAATFINIWGNHLGGHVLPKSLHVPNLGKSKYTPTIPGKPNSMKEVEPVGDYWLTASNCQMGTHSFLVTAKQLDHIESNICGLGQAGKISSFEALSAIIWKLVSKIRKDSGPRIVTVCTSNSHDRGNEIPNNGMVISTVEADFSVVKADVSELALCIAEKKVDEDKMIEESLKADGKLDFIMYGANFTFVNLEQVEIYGLELNGQKPIFANYTVGGVGNQGVVLVLPGPESGKEEGGNGRTVTAILPEEQLAELKKELQKDWNIV